MSTDWNLHSIRARAQQLVSDARAVGVVLTIDLEPRPPLSMGRYDMVVGVRPNRQMAAPAVQHLFSEDTEGGGL